MELRFSSNITSTSLFIFTSKTTPRVSLPYTTSERARHPPLHPLNKGKQLRRCSYNQVGSNVYRCDRAEWVGEYFESLKLSRAGSVPSRGSPTLLANSVPSSGTLHCASGPPPLTWNWKTKPSPESINQGWRGSSFVLRSSGSPPVMEFDSGGDDDGCTHCPRLRTLTSCVET